MRQRRGVCCARPHILPPASTSTTINLAMQKDENIAAERTQESAHRTKEAAKDTLRDAKDYAGAKAHNIKKDVKDKFESKDADKSSFSRDDLQQSQALGQESGAKSEIPVEKSSSDWKASGSGSSGAAGSEKTWTETAKEKFTGMKDSIVDTFKNPVASTEETTASGLRKTGDLEEDAGRYLERDADKRRHAATKEKAKDAVYGSKAV
jgi:hypothetical protein